MSTPLTPEQRKRMEENRRIALEKRAARMGQTQNANNSVKSDSTGSSLNPNASTFVPRALDLPKAQGPGPGFGSGSLTKHQNSFPTSPAKAPYGQTTGVSLQKSFNGNQSSANVQSKFSNDLVKKNANKEGPNSSWNIMTAPLAGTLSLIAKDRFICYIGFNQKLNDIFKSIEGALFDSVRKKWTFPLDKYDELRKKIEPLAPNITVGKLPKNVLKMFSKKNETGDDYKNLDISCIEPALLNSLFEFQKEGVKFGIFKQGKCLIADEMGLGKTLQALAIVDYYHEDWPILVICPSSMRFQWQEEILRYLKKIPSYGIMVVTNGKMVVEDAKVVIISYDLVSKLKDLLLKLKFGVLICDESHSIKSGKAIRTKAVLEIAKKAKRVILLSGTPALSRPKELFNQFKAIAPSLFPDKMEYGVRYCDGRHDKFGWNDNGASHLEELKLIIEGNVMIRRLKADVLDQLPSKIRQVVYLNEESGAPKSTKMKGLEKALQKELSGSEKRSTLLAYYSESGKTKLKAICSHLEQLLEQEKKFLVFAHHKDVMNGICELLEEKKTYYIRIDGAVQSEDRKSVCDQFQELDKFRVAVLSITAANTGLTLTAAQMVVFAELFWNPGHLLQAEDRAHRIGQKNCVLVQYLIARGTADDHIWPLVQSKLSILNLAGLSKDDSMKIASEALSQSSSQSSSQSKISDFFKEMEDDIDTDALSELMDQIDALEDLDDVPKKKRKRS